MSDEAATEKAAEEKPAEADAAADAKPAFRSSVYYQAILLGVFSMGAAALLATGNWGTADAIKQRLAEDLQKSLSQVVPPSYHDNNLAEAKILVKTRDGKEKTVYQAMRGEKVVGSAFQSVGFGYAGAITVLMGLNDKGELMGVRVLAHAETPGLGDKIEIAKDDWILAFDGLSLDNTPEKDWGVKKDGGMFDQFSGATITRRAVVKAVKDGLDFYAAKKAEIMAPPAPKPAEAAKTEGAAQ